MTSELLGAFRGFLSFHPMLFEASLLSVSLIAGILGSVLGLAGSVIIVFLLERDFVYLTITAFGLCVLPSGIILGKAI